MNAQGNLIALGTIARREVMRILRIWSQTLLPPAITMTLYFIFFGQLVGSRIGEMQPGISYIEYIAPGLIMTENALKNMPKERQDEMLALGRSKRLGFPNDIASAVVMLASDDGEWINGQVISVDGGTVLR